MLRRPEIDAGRTGQRADMHQLKHLRTWCNTRMANLVVDGLVHDLEPRAVSDRCDFCSVKVAQAQWCAAGRKRRLR